MTREQLDAISAAVKMPLMLGGGASGLDRDYLASRRVRIALQGHQPFSAAVQAVYNTLKALRDGTKPADLQGIASAETMQRVTRDGDYKTWTEKFLGGDRPLPNPPPPCGRGRPSLRLVRLVQHRRERGRRLLQFGGRIGALDHVGERDADRVAELGDRHDLRQAGRAIFTLVQQVVEPFLAGTRCASPARAAQ